MSGSKRKKMLADALRIRIRQLMAADYSEARIAREVGKSHKHVAQIVAQEKASGA